MDVSVQVKDCDPDRRNERDRSHPKARQFPRFVDESFAIKFNRGEPGAARGGNKKMY